MTRVTMLRHSDRVALAASIDDAWSDQRPVWVVASDIDATGIAAMGGGVVEPGVAERLVAQGRTEVDLPVPTDTATIVTSSGTTGPRKVVCLSRSALDASGRGAHHHLRLDSEDRWGLVLPLHHVAGQSILWRSRMLGTTPVIQQRLAPGALDDAGVTVVSLVSTQVRRMVATETHLAAHVLLGGGAIAASLLRDGADHVGGITRSYGLTETAGGCVYDGIPFPGTEVVARDGLLGLRGPTLASGLLTPAGMRPITDADGWLWTNDLGAVDDGVVSVVGRADDVVITGGVNVNPASVEVVLEEHPAVARAGVVGVEDREWGQRLVAAVVLHTADGRVSPDVAPPATSAPTPSGGDHRLPNVDEGLAGELRASVRRELGAAAAPTTFVVADDLPLTSLGKIARHELTAMLAAR
ncbi:MAG TPA: AMP-binding protein [Nitriliruptoraceae bacterium]|nr:AMP-binding protein [Nitriliruptoraceae bacterium]